MASLLCWHGLQASAQEAERPDSCWQALLDSIVEERMPRGAQASVYAYDLSARRPLYARQPDALCRPASTMKLLTAITALQMPRADEPFRTRLVQTGIVRGDTLHGDLYVIGGFDPEFDEDDLDSLVHCVARQPYSVIAGRICGDVSAKDSLRWGAGWLWDDEPDAFQPYLSPLMLCKGVVSISASPALTGQPPTLTGKPASTYYTFDNRATSHQPRHGPLRLTRNWLEGGNCFIASGSSEGRVYQQFSVAGSERFFMHTFAERLREHGIIVAGTDTVTYAIASLPPDANARTLCVIETPMQDVLDQMLKESDNLNAEAVLWRIGRQSGQARAVSAKEGIKVVKGLVERLGHNPKHFSLADGCGLSQYDYVSPRLLVDFLRFAYDTPDIRARLTSALPMAGIDGTLKYRMPRGTPGFRNVRAKTGSYTGINALAGYLHTVDGHDVAFAIMVQNVLNARAARQLQDEVCAFLIHLPLDRP